jgi:Mannosylglycerate hydrolase MGH1-like glycoside hydrolase domain
LPLCASTVISPHTLARVDRLRTRLGWVVKERSVLLQTIAPPHVPGAGGRHLLAILDETKLRRVLARMLDENEFLSPFGIRSLSRAHLHQPYDLWVDGHQYRVAYQPAESDSGLFGGNSNWRGPIWMPVNVLIVRALANLYAYYGDDFRVECPTGSGQLRTIDEIATELARRLARIFLERPDGSRAVLGDDPAVRGPLWRDYVPFYEYFHAETGAGLGASHQTGWTALVAQLLSEIG